MIDLISRSELLKEIEKYKFGAISNDAEREYIKNVILDFINFQPAAYDIDKVVEKLESFAKLAEDRYVNGTSNYAYQEHKCWVKSIEIVKQGGVRNNRKDCEYRHDNGNCLKVGGFCTSVDDKHCEKLKKDSVSDDVCEWKYTKEIMDNTEFKVGCNTNALKRGVVPNNFSYHDFKYCPYCGKKIKVVE